MIVSIHFAAGVVVPDSNPDRREWHFFAQDGWDIRRDAEGVVTLTHAERGRVVVDGYAYSFVEQSGMALEDPGSPDLDSVPPPPPDVTFLEPTQKPRKGKR